MVSVVGLEFSYTQAPRTMKSLVVALWYLSVSLGNLFAAGVNSFLQDANGACGSARWTTICISRR